MDDINNEVDDSQIGRRSRTYSRFMLDGNENPLEDDGSEVRSSEKIQNNFSAFAMDQTAGVDPVEMM
jgi:hypothetical protein